MVPMLSIVRNFFLGSEPTKGVWPFRYLDMRAADEIVRAELQKMGIHVRDTSEPVGTLSGGERQSIAIARAVYFGARVLILDEPTFTLLNRGRSQGTFSKGQITRAELIQRMAGGQELEELTHELGEIARTGARLSDASGGG